MSKMDVLRFVDAWRECQTHLKHARHAVVSLAPHLPLTGTVLGELDLEVIQDIDQLVLRYSKLQDCMGNRLFPALLKILMEPFEDRPMLDKLHRLEKMGVLPSVARWQVCHGRSEYARDEDGDGVYEVHVNTIEGFWSLLRSWLRPHRGISQEKLPKCLSVNKPGNCPRNVGYSIKINHIDGE